MNQILYSELPLDSESNSDDSEVLYIKANNTLANRISDNSDLDQHRGIVRQKDKRKSTGKRTKFENIELRTLLAYRNIVNVSRKSWTKKRSPICCVLTFATIVVFILLGLILGLRHYLSKPLLVKTGRDWTISLDEYGSESCVRLVDVNQDGALDVLAAAVYSLSKVNTNSFRGTLVALDGRDGRQLWQVETEAEVFTMNCGDIDINQDGTPECICNGRKGLLIAVDPLKGAILWESRSPYINREYNTYQVIAIPDLDSDGIPDMVLSNGGNQSAGPEETHRKPGRLVLISSRTGNVIGSYMDIPDSRETYMPPVLYHASDGSDYVLFGTGGESISGALMAISVKDLYHTVTSQHKDRPVTFSGSNQAWAKYRDNRTNIITLHKTQQKGVMVPPLIADFNNDGTDDIFSLTFDGHVILFDGSTLDVIWQVYYDDCETYSSPAPGYFNDDPYIDVLMHWNNGSWPKYSTSIAVILSGLDGSILWSVTTDKSVMTSDLSLHTYSPKHDLFVFTMRGLSLSNDTSRDRQQRHLQGPHGRCSEDISHEDSHIFTVDRSTATQPRLVTSIPASYYYYNLTNADKEEISKYNKEASSHYRPGPFCSVMSGIDRNAGAIGDLDGDGSLSWVKIHSQFADLHDWTGSFYRVKYVTYIRKIRLRHDWKPGKFVNMNISSYVGGSSSDKITDKHMMFLPYSNQQWTEYLGRYGGHYETKIST